MSKEKKDHKLWHTNAQDGALNALSEDLPIQAQLIQDA
jgi:hypothetical protein